MRDSSRHCCAWLLWYLLGPWQKEHNRTSAIYCSQVTSCLMYQALCCLRGGPSHRGQSGLSAHHLFLQRRAPGAKQCYHQTQGRLYQSKASPPWQLLCDTRTTVMSHNFDYCFMHLPVLTEASWGIIVWQVPLASSTQVWKHTWWDGQSSIFGKRQEEWQTMHQSPRKIDYASVTRLMQPKPQLSLCEFRTYKPRKWSLGKWPSDRCKHTLLCPLNIIFTDTSHRQHRFPRVVFWCVLCQIIIDHVNGTMQCIAPYAWNEQYRSCYPKGSV